MSACLFALLINAGRFPSGIHRSRSPRYPGAAGGDICGHAAPVLSARLGLCVWMSVFSPVWRAHK